MLPSIEMYFYLLKCFYVYIFIQVCFSIYLAATHHFGECQYVFCKSENKKKQGQCCCYLKYFDSSFLTFTTYKTCRNKKRYPIKLFVEILLVT